MSARLAMTLCVALSQAACVTEDEGVVSFLQQEVVKQPARGVWSSDEDDSEGPSADDDSDGSSAEVPAASAPKAMSVDTSAEEADLDGEARQPIDYSIPKRSYQPLDDEPRAGVWTEEPNFGNQADLTKTQLDLNSLEQRIKDGQATYQALDESQVQMMSTLADMGGRNKPTKASVEQQETMVASQTQRTEEAAYAQLVSTASKLKAELATLQDVPEIDAYNKVVQEMQSLQPKVEELHKSIMQTMGGEFYGLRSKNEELLANLTDLRYKKADDLSTIMKLQAELEVLKAPLRANEQQAKLQAERVEQQAKLQTSLDNSLDSIGEQAVKELDGALPA